MIDFYDDFLKELDAFMGPIVKKHLRKCAKQRAESKPHGTLMQDWDALNKGYRDAMAYILAHHSETMHIAGMLKHCDYKPPEADE